MKHIVLALAVAAAPGALAAQAGPAVASPPTAARPDVERAVMGISEKDFARRVGIIAHDSMQGRDTPSPGLDKTARWIAAEFERFGLRPGGDDGTFLQRYPIRMLALDVAGSGLRATPGGTLAYGTDLLPLPVRAPGPSRAEGEVAILAGGTGLERVEQWDLAGRHVVLVLPPSLSSGRALFGLLQALSARGVGGVLVASDADDEAWGTVAAGLEEARWLLRGGPPREQAALLQVRDGALQRILEPRGIDVRALRARAEGPLERTDVEGLTVAVTQEVQVVEESAPNVVGILEGSDPRLRSEYVVYSAHMDHVGIGRPDASGDSIFNGADDDASGTAAVIEVAEAMASLETPPARSMIFLLVSGEEKGLWGSSHFAENPPVPVESMVANFNADMVGRNWSDTIVAIGREHSDLGETLARVNRAHPELRMTAIDDLWPEERFYFRSDHYNFARKGVPVLFFFNGTHDDYHRPSDEPERIDAEKASRIARLLFHLGMDVGHAADRPAWDPESFKQIVEGGRAGR